MGGGDGAKNMHVLGHRPLKAAQAAVADPELAVISSENESNNAGFEVVQMHCGVHKLSSNKAISGY